MNVSSVSGIYGVRQGLWAGLLTVVVFVIAWQLDKNYLFNPWLWWLSWAIYLVAMFLAAAKQAGGSFRAALQAAFVTFIVANGLYYLFYYLLLGHIDPELVALQAEKMAAHPMAADWDIQEEDLVIRPGQMLLRYAYSLIGGFLLSLAIAWGARYRHVSYSH